MKGPVPTGVVLNLRPYFSTASRGTIDKLDEAKAYNAKGLSLLSLMDKL